MLAVVLEEAGGGAHELAHGTGAAHRSHWPTCRGQRGVFS